MAALAGSTVVACAGGTETGNPSFGADLAYAAYSSNPRTASVRQAAGGAVVSSAWLVLGDVSFVREGGCAAPPAGTTPHAPGLGVGNHASGEPVVTAFEMVGGGFCGVDVPLVHAAAGALPSGAPAELTQDTIVLEGTLADGAAFSLRSAATPRVRLTADGGRFEMSASEATVLIGFDVAAWLGGLDWAAATRQGGAVVVSADSNSALLAGFEKNLALGVVLYRDRNADGQLDANPVALAHAR
jgi:hypothetical protein